MRTFWAWAKFILLLSFASPSVAETNQLFAGTKIDDRAQDEIAQSMLNAYMILNEGFFTGRADAGFDKMNFYFAAGSDFISDFRVTTEALTPFDDNTQNSIMQLNTNSDICYVQPIKKEGGGQIVLSVYNFKTFGEDGMLHCLTAGLWFFQKGTIEGLDLSDWRKSFVELVSD